jgi:hypothetical protein
VDVHVLYVAGILARLSTPQEPPVPARRLRDSLSCHGDVDKIVMRCDP